MTVRPQMSQNLFDAGRRRAGMYRRLRTIKVRWLLIDKRHLLPSGVQHGTLLIKLAATSVNSIDTKRREGALAIAPPLPAVLGSDIAGAEVIKFREEKVEAYVERLTAGLGFDCRLRYGGR